MKKVKKILILALVFGIFQMYSQERKTDGILNTTTTKTMNWDKNGTKIPYKVTIQEKRIYTSGFVQNQENKENYDRQLTPTLVSKMIAIKSDVDSSLNGIIVLRYEKQVTDTFEVKSTPKGFAVEVDGKVLEFNMGQRTYYSHKQDNDFFVVEEYDMMQ